MLAGFAFSSLKMNFPQDTNPIFSFVYLAVTACAIGLELCAILNAATCSVFGPGKFLRGKGGVEAANAAVRVLEDKTDITLGYFMCGLYCVILSSGMKALIQYSGLNALIVWIGLSFMTVILVKSGRRIFTNMYVSKSNATSGVIHAEQINDPTNVQLNLF